MPWIVTLRVYAPKKATTLRKSVTVGMLRPSVNAMLNEACKTLDSAVEPIRDGVQISIVATYERNKRG